jgi:hypothetical protein
MSTRRVMGHAFAGGGLGLCVGVLVGMTTSPVVGTVIGALTALFATIFGGQLTLSPQPGQPTMDPTGFARIGAFGAMCTVGVLLGVTIRAHNLLGETPAAEVKALEEAGYSKPVALQLVMYRTFGLVMSDAEHVHASKEGAAPPPNLNQSSLSAGPAAGECRQYATSQYGDDPLAIVTSWRKAGGDWANMASAIAAVPPDKQFALAKAAWSLACAGQ